VLMLRGDQLQQRKPLAVVSPSAITPSASTASRSGAGDSIYGVPTSAVQHCCGRGCKHCRIYWNRGKV